MAITGTGQSGSGPVPTATAEASGSVPAVTQGAPSSPAAAQHISAGSHLPIQSRRSTEGLTVAAGQGDDDPANRPAPRNAAMILRGRDLTSREKFIVRYATRLALGATLGASGIGGIVSASGLGITALTAQGRQDRVQAEASATPATIGEALGLLLSLGALGATLYATWNRANDKALLDAIEPPHAERLAGMLDTLLHRGDGGENVELRNFIDKNSARLLPRFVQLMDQSLATRLRAARSLAGDHRLNTAIGFPAIEYEDHLFTEALKRDAGRVLDHLAADGHFAARVLAQARTRIANPALTHVPFFQQSLSVDFWHGQASGRPQKPAGAIADGLTFRVVESALYNDRRPNTIAAIGAGFDRMIALRAAQE